VTKGRRAAALLLLAAALGLATLGQYYFFRRRDYLWDGLVFDALAVLCFLLAWRQISHRATPAHPGRLRVEPGRWSVQPILLAAGLLFSFVATLLSRSRAWNQTTTGAVIVWLIGIACAAAAALWPAAARFLPRARTAALGDLLPWLRRISRDTWIEIATVAALTLLAFLLRAAALDSVPYTLGGDEAWHGLLARQVLRGELSNPFVMGYMSMPTFFYWPLSWSLWLVGDGMVGLRLPSALAGALTVPLFYGLVRSLRSTAPEAVWGRRTALLSALFLAAYDYHIHFSRLGANNVWDPLFAVLIFWAVDRGLGAGKQRPETAGGSETRPCRAGPLILAGMVLGLAFYFYTGARLLPVLVVVYATFVWLQRRRETGASFGELIRPLAVIGVALVIVAGPILSFALAHPNDWNARVNQIGIIQSGWLAREPGLTGKGTAQILAEQVLRSAGAFHVFVDRTVWYGADRPLLGFLAGICALLGMAWAVAHWRERRYFLILIWFWGVILTGGALTEGPPSSQRLVMAIPAVCLLVAVGLEVTVDLARRLLGAHPIAEKLALGLLIAALAASSVHYYFATFTPSHRYGSANGETATMIGHYLRGQAPGTQVYFLGAPRIYWGFGTMGFLAPQVAGHDIEQPLTGPPDLPDLGQTPLFVFLPDRAGELQWVQAAFPGGRVREFHDDLERLRFIVYAASP